MSSKQFFKPTPLYKEYLILDLIEKKSNITQRELSNAIGAAVSMINSYLDEYEKKGFIIKNYISDKKIEYIITKKGIERRKVLNIGFIKSSHEIYVNAKENIRFFINQVVQKGYRNILLYGAGEVAELLLLVVNDDISNIKVLGVIDDDVNKIGKSIYNYPIIGIESINLIEHDGILISSYTNRDIIYDKLIYYGYDKDKIIMFIEK